MQTPGVPAACPPLPRPPPTSILLQPLRRPRTCLNLALPVHGTAHLCHQGPWGRTHIR